jgi:hypothetical protein
VHATLHCSAAELAISITNPEVLDCRTLPKPYGRLGPLLCGNAAAPRFGRLGFAVSVEGDEDIKMGLFRFN